MPYLFITLVIVGLDQVSKFLVQRMMFPFQSVALLNGWPSFTYARNYGAAFGIFPSQTYLLISITIAVLVLTWLNRKQLREYPRIFQIGLALALGGALGNFVDRVTWGYVVDFIDLQFWPVFNIADIGILIGVSLVALALIYRDLEQKKQKLVQGEEPKVGASATEEEML